MFRSKALKDFSNDKRSKLYLWWIQTPVADKYYEFTWKFFSQPISRIKKLYGWYKNVFHNDFDFDGHCLFAIIEYKLKRVQKCLEKGHAIQEDQDMKALQLAIKLAGRLKDDSYDEPFWNRHDRKWGESKNWFEDCNDGSGNSYWRSSRPNANTEEEKAAERADHLTHCYAADAKRNREEKWLYGILNKYLRRWWD